MVREAEVSKTQGDRDLRERKHKEITPTKNVFPSEEFAKY